MKRGDVLCVLAVVIVVFGALCYGIPLIPLLIWSFVYRLVACPEYRNWGAYCGTEEEILDREITSSVVFLIVVVILILKWRESRRK
jgi:hypothetical protein